jgi:hypothetical protein
MQYVKALTLFTLFFTIFSSALLDVSFAYCDSVAESRECNETNETEEIEKLETDEIYLTFSLKTEVLKEHQVTPHTHSEINIKDVFLSIVLPPPDIV